MGLYPKFSCLADRCPATCCSGWKIVVDQEAYQRFIQIDDEELRQDILANMMEENGTFRFVNRPDGSCAMLDSDGLCRIQKNTYEEMLCNTCRKFPRIIARVSGWNQGAGTVGVSFAASCPVVAGYILDGLVSWLWLEETGKLHPLSHPQYEWMQRLTGMPGTVEQIGISWELPDLFDIFVGLSLEVLDILVRFPETPYLEQSFDLYYMEVPDLAAFGSFFAETGQSWHMFARQYQSYRYPSRYLESPEEDGSERTKQISGELLIMRMMLCSRYVLRGKLERIDWLETLHWVYRFSVHGKKMAEQVHGMIISWNNEFLKIAYEKVCSRK